VASFKTLPLTTKLPFDIIDERTIFYTNDMLGVIELRDGLEKYVTEALTDDKPDNPIYRAIESQMIIQQSSSTDLDVNKYLIDRLDSIEKSINRGDRVNRMPPEEIKQLLTINVKVNQEIITKEITKDIREVLSNFNMTNIQFSYPRTEIIEEDKTLRIKVRFNNTGSLSEEFLDSLISLTNERYEISV